MAVTSVLIGVLIGKSSQPTAPVVQTPADDGKLAKTYKEKVVLKVIRENAKDLQKCYFELLDKKPKITEGEIDVLFKVEEDGKISSAKITRNQLGDTKLESCVSNKLESYYLAPPPIGINRYISHVLAFKSEATANQEAKDKAEKKKMPKTF